MSTDESEKVSTLTERIDNLIDRIDRFEEVADSQFVRRAEFEPIKLLAYGGVGIVLATVVGALLTLVIR